MRRAAGLGATVLTPPQNCRYRSLELFGFRPNDLGPERHVFLGDVA
jgi:hypothetical protein